MLLNNKVYTSYDEASDLQDILSEESSLILGEQRDVIVKFDRVLDP